MLLNTVSDGNTMLKKFLFCEKSNVVPNEQLYQPLLGINTKKFHRYLSWTGWLFCSTFTVRQSFLMQLNFSVRGSWSEYGEWSECSVDCGGGTLTRSRTCNNPTPASGIAICEGDAEQKQSCDTNTCDGKNLLYVCCVPHAIFISILVD